MKNKIQRWLWLGCLLLLWLSASPAHAFYNPTTGRWLSRDPLQEGGGANIYEYCKDEPVSRVDYVGLEYLPYPFPHDSDASSYVYAPTPQEQLGQTLVLHYLFGGGRPLILTDLSSVNAIRPYLKNSLGGNLTDDMINSILTRLCKSRALQHQQGTIRLYNNQATIDDNGILKTFLFQGHLSVSADWFQAGNCVCLNNLNYAFDDEILLKDYLRGLLGDIPGGWRKSWFDTWAFGQIHLNPLLILADGTGMLREYSLSIRWNEKGVKCRKCP